MHFLTNILVFCWTYRLATGDLVFIVNIKKISCKVNKQFVVAI